ncbi:hypothetical protein FD754_021210, partial [Muntiacus muntjak]
NKEHRLRNHSQSSCEPQLLSPCALEPKLHNRRGHHNEKPEHRNWSTTRESPHAARKTQRKMKISPPPPPAHPPNASMTMEPILYSEPRKSLWLCCRESRPGILLGIFYQSSLDNFLTTNFPLPTGACLVSGKVSQSSIYIDFPRGSVITTLPSNEGNVDLIPGRETIYTTCLRTQPPKKITYYYPRYLLYCSLQSEHMVVYIRSGKHANPSLLNGNTIQGESSIDCHQDTRVFAGSGSILLVFYDQCSAVDIALPLSLYMGQCSPTLAGSIKKASREKKKRNVVCRVPTPVSQSSAFKGVNPRWSPYSKFSPNAWSHYVVSRGISCYLGLFSGCLPFNMCVSHSAEYIHKTEAILLITKLVILITKGCPSGLWHWCQPLSGINLCQLNLILQTLVIYHRDLESTCYVSEVHGLKGFPSNGINGQRGNVKCLPTVQETRVQSLGWEDLLEKEMQYCPKLPPMCSHVTLGMCFLWQLTTNFLVWSDRRLIFRYCCYTWIFPFKSLLLYKLPLRSDLLFKPTMGLTDLRAKPGHNAKIPKPQDYPFSSFLVNLSPISVVCNSWVSLQLKDANSDCQSQCKDSILYISLYVVEMPWYKPPVRLEWPTDLAVNPMDNSLYVLDNNIVLQISENRRVRIIAGRPIHCQVPGIDHFLVSKVAIHSTLESARAISVSHSGLLFIAETDERKVNRIQQVTTNGEISIIAGAPTDCDCKIDPNCDCFSGDGGYAKDAKMKAPSSLAVSPDGTLYVADLGNVRIRTISRNQAHLNDMNLYEIASPADQELYQFTVNGTHLHTLNLITRDYVYNFTYNAEGDLGAITSSNGNSVHIRRDASGMPLWLVVPGGQVYWLTISSNGVLKRVSAQGYNLALMTYPGNTGLLATKSNENGWTTVYEYDPEGHLTNATFPTGDVSSFHSDLEKLTKVELDTSSRENVLMSTNLTATSTIYILKQENTQSTYRVSPDGSLRVTFASGMEISLSSEPHILAGAVNPTLGKCNISLPGEHNANLIEWRQRKEQNKGNISAFERRLRAHNRNLLSIDFDHMTRTGKIYDDHRKFTLRILYDQTGRPVLWSPVSRYNEVNITYSPSGLVTFIQRGTWNEKMEYDQSGKIISRTWADGKIWSYTYLEKSVMLLLHSQRRYIFEYDQSDCLLSVTMPSMVRHSLQTMLSVGYYRNIYTPPDSSTSFIQDYSRDGRLLQTLHLGTGRRVLYKYTKQARLSEILYDTTQVTLTYEESSGVIKTIHLMHDGFICTIRYRQTGPLIGRQIFRFSEEGLVNARFDYSYNNFRVTSMQAVINETPLPIDLYRYVDVSGRTEQFGKFSVINYDLNQVITTTVMKHTKIFSANGQVIEVQYEILKAIAYWMTIQYDNMGRMVICDIRVGVDANITRYFYEYDADGQLQTVSVNDKTQWRYSYDLNGNINLLSHGNSARLTPLRYDLRDRITRLGEIQYKMDEDGFLRQRGNDVFEYNSNGLLQKAYNKASGWTVQYYYDGLGRRVASKSSPGQHLQFFYADLANPIRVTHLYNHTSSEITSLYYDLQGHLIAMELSSGEEYYVACDNTGTPLAVFSSRGQVIKEILYTPYGDIYHDTYPDFQVIIGFHGGLYDFLTKLVHLGQRDYDVVAGRWTTPNHHIWKQLNLLPKPFNLYSFENNYPVGKIQDVAKYTTDIGSWLELFGFQLHNVLPGFPKPELENLELTYELLQLQTKTQEWDPGKTILGIQCELQKQLRNFISLDQLPMTPRYGDGRCPEGGKQPRFAAVPSVFGKGIKFAIKDGIVTADIIGVANEDSRRLAAILNNAHYLENLHFTIEGRDTHYFIKLGSLEEDLVLIGNTGGRRILENGVNVTVSQMTSVLNGRTRRFADIQLQHGALCFNIRYGTTVEEEKNHVLEIARQRAVAQAWTKEQRRLQEGEEGIRAWTEGEKQQLLSTGRVQGYDGYFVLSVEQYLELSDSANNIHFMRQSEIGRR